MPVAHVGHWLAELLYVVPVLAVVAWISVRSLLDRRRGNGSGGDEREPDREGDRDRE